MARNLYYEDEVIDEKFSFFMLKRLVFYAKKYKATYVKLVLMLICASIFSLTPATINMLIINEVLPQNSVIPDNLIAKAVVLLICWFSLSMGYVIMDYFMGKASNIAGNSVICDLRKDLFDKLMKLSFEYYDSHPTGKILVRITNYTDEIATFFIHDMMRVVQNAFQILMALIVILFIEARMALVVLIAGVPMFLLIWVLAVKVYKCVRIDRNKRSNRTAFAVEDINGLEVVKAFNREDLNAKIFDELSDKYLKAYMTTARYRELFFPLSYSVVKTTCTVVLYATALFITTQNFGAPLTLGALVAITTVMQRFSNSVFSVCQRLQAITNVSSNIERIFEILDEPEGITNCSTAKDIESIEGNVDFEHVSFSYVDGVPVLEDLNLHINAGQMIALVGPTGAGKTTIVSLLSRFYDVTSGSIKIDDTDIRDMTLKSLHRHIGIMMQDTFLFQGTIIDNIRFSRPDATDDECIEAAKEAYAHEFIIKKKDGYQTMLSNNGSELSSGEKQLISFARLILSQPKIIILDEATSNIDTKTEKCIQKLFTTVLKDKTSFIIAHRLSTIRNADRILYIADKGIVEDGSHDELMQIGGAYASLIR